MPLPRLSCFWKNSKVNRTARRALDRHAGDIITAFDAAGPFPGQEATPEALAAAVRECLETCTLISQEQGEDSETGLPPEELDELSDCLMECLSDLGLWAWQLKRDEARAGIEDLALDAAQWLSAHGAQISVLEPAVNALTRQANASSDPAALKTLFERGCAIISCTSEAISGSRDPAVLQPWLMLHFNCAIIATRSGDGTAMNAAYDLLESQLPGHCVTFFREGLAEVSKPAYSEAARQAMRQRFAKWTAQG